MGVLVLECPGHHCSYGSASASSDMIGAFFRRARFSIRFIHAALRNGILLTTTLKKTPSKDQSPRPSSSSDFLSFCLCRVPCQPQSLKKASSCIHTQHNTVLTTLLIWSCWLVPSFISSHRIVPVSTTRWQTPTHYSGEEEEQLTTPYSTPYIVYAHT
jgi:hypothetical protein